MSVDAIRWAWQQVTGKSSAKLVLLSLADRAGENNECWPSISRIEKDTELDRKTIFSAILELERMGIIAVTKTLGAGNKYTLLGVIDRHMEAAPTSTKNGTSTKIGTSTKNGTNQSRKRDTHQYQKRYIEPSIEPINNPLRGFSNTTAETKKDALATLSDFGITGQLAKDFISHRKTKKAAITHTAMEGFKREAAKAGISITEAVTIAIDRGWIGFNAGFDWKPGAKNSQQNRLQEIRDAIYADF